MWVSRPYLRQYLVVILVNMSIFAVGLGMVWSSPMLVKLKDDNNTVLGRAIKDEEASWVASSTQLVSWVVMFIAPYIADRYGRKTVILYALIPRIIVYVCLSFANNIWIIIFARAMKGCVDVCTLIVVPVYASEIASVDIRGGLGSVVAIVMSFSSLLMYVVSPFLDFHIMNMAISATVIVTAIPIVFLPESPYFLLRIGKTEEAAKVLTFLRCSKSMAYKEIEAYSSRADPKTNILKELKKTNVVKGLALSIFLSCSTHFTGVSALGLYLQPVLESSNSGLPSELASVFVCFITLLASICSASITDRFGRKPIMINSLIGMATGMVGLGAYFKLIEWHYTIDGVLKYIPMICLSIVSICLCLGLGSLLWPLMSELLDGPIRAFGFCCAFSVGTIISFVTSMSFPLFLSSLGPAITFWIFGGNCIIIGLVFMLFVPETKRRSFAEIQKMLGEKTVEDGEFK